MLLGNCCGEKIDSVKTLSTILILQLLHICASEDLRQSTSHETNGQAKTEEGVQHAPEFLSILSNCCFVVKISIKVISEA